MRPGSTPTQLQPPSKQPRPKASHHTAEVSFFVKCSGWNLMGGQAVGCQFSSHREAYVQSLASYRAQNIFFSLAFSLFLYYKESEESTLLDVFRNVIFQPKMKYVGQIVVHLCSSSLTDLDQYLYDHLNEHLNKLLNELLMNCQMK